MKLVYKLLWPELITFPCPMFSQEIPLRAMRAVQFQCPSCGAMLRVLNAFVRGLMGMPVTIAGVILLLLQVHPWWRYAMLVLLLAFFLRTIAGFVMILVPPEIEPCDAPFSLTDALRKR
jgi:hypothetical protein